ncbi:hypothetical protein INT45_009671 [Circinella minor]|uniref:Reverse transcriptase domain-containing protein n=1 Tax=Circinella minor TaxID=1195481 RepID=A0A8H7RTI7_9FUNG|nr:hypothetical protein INT45_009671 [Circinella minor]
MSSSNIQDNTTNNTPVQENRRVNGEGDVNMEMGRLSITEQDANQEHQTSLKTYLHLKQQVKEADIKYQEAIENQETLEEQSKLLDLLMSAQANANKYRDICWQRSPSKQEFMTKQEIDNQSESHYIPKDLPVLQIVGSDKWHPGKIVHLSTEMFLRAFEKEIRAANLKVQDNWSRLLRKSFNDAQNIWLDAVLQEFPGSTWDEIRVKIVEQFDKPEQRLKSMESALHMRQRHGEKVKTYARKFHQRCIESGLDKYLEVMIMALLSSLEKKNDVYDLVATKFSSDILKQSMNDMVNYVAGLQLDSTENDKRSREDDAITTHPNRRPRLSVHGSTSLSRHNPANQRPRQPRYDPNTCIYCHQERKPGHTCEAYRKAKGFRWQHRLQEAAFERVERLMFNKKLTTQLMMVFLKTDINQEDETLIPITVEKRRVFSLLDGGATFSAIDRNFCNKENIKVLPVHGYICLASSDKKSERIGITEPLEVWHNGHCVKHSFEVMNITRSHLMSIGKNLFNSFGIGYTGLASTWKDLEEKEKSQEKEIDDALIPNNAPAGTEFEQVTFKAYIHTGLEKNRAIDKTSFCPLPEAVISLPTPTDVVCHRRQYKIPYKAQDAVEDEIKKWIDNGTIIEIPADEDNRWNFPLTTTMKKNQKIRTCLDVRLLNQYLKSDMYEIPLLSKIFDSLTDARVYTTLDLASAFNRFPVKKSNQHKLAFTSPKTGTRYMFQDCPFGLKPISSKFQRVMDKLFRDLDYCHTFVDDIIIASKALEEHAQHVSIVIDRLTEANLILHEEKCVFMQKSVYVLGHQINEKGYAPNCRKLTNVDSWPIPKSSSEVMSLLGFFGYFRQFIPHMSDITKPLDDLRYSKDVVSQWG